MMMMSNFRSRVGRAVVGLLTVLVGLFSAPLVEARQADTTLLSSRRIAVALADERQAPVITAVPQATVAPAPAFWELISGFEGDTNGSGYGFFGPSYVRPIRPG